MDAMGATSSDARRVEIDNDDLELAERRYEDSLTAIGKTPKSTRPRSFAMASRNTRNDASG
jgi:hypothetical protein